MSPIYFRKIVRRSPGAARRSPKPPGVRGVTPGAPASPPGVRATLPGGPRRPPRRSRASAGRPCTSAPATLHARPASRPFRRRCPPAPGPRPAPPAALRVPLRSAASSPASRSRASARRPRPTAVPPAPLRPAPYAPRIASRIACVSRAPSRVNCAPKHPGLVHCTRAWHAMGAPSRSSTAISTRVPRGGRSGASTTTPTTERRTIQPADGAPPGVPNVTGRGTGMLGLLG